MIFLRFDMKDSRVVYGNPNCVFREGRGILLEFGDPEYVQLQPGQPGYEAPPKPRARRRAHRSPAENPNPNTTTPMDGKFHFNVIPKPGGSGNTTRIVLQEELGTAGLVAAVQAGLTARGVTATAEQITATGEEIAKASIAALAQGRPVRRAFGYFTYEPSCGGVFDSPDFLPTVDNMNAGVRGRLAPDGQALFDGQITFERDGVKGEKVPMISRIYDGATRQLDRITLGGPFRINGPEDFGPEPSPAATTLGIFLARTGGAPVRIGMFSKWTDSEIFGSWPAAIPGTGDVELRIATLYPSNTSPSVFIYGTLLPVVP
jgi:hypothetical protein